MRAFTLRNNSASNERRISLSDCQSMAPLKLSIGRYTGKTCDTPETQQNQGLKSRISLSHNGGMKYGYARTSTDDQTTALQLAALKRARCAHIFEDKGLAGAGVKRPALARCLKTLRAGDTLIVWKLDRLGRINAVFAKRHKPEIADIATN
jgi:hypothetical protein